MRNVPKTLRTRRHEVLCTVIVEARKAAGLSQRQLATKLRWQQSSVAALERRERRVDVVEFLQLAEALDVPPLELLALVILRR
jgi:transcriptional regulator with XRE-family HTH domain